MQPLKHFIRIAVSKDDEGSMMLLKYERLLEYCFRNSDVHEMRGADVGRSVGVHELVSLATSKEIVEGVVVGSVQCHDAAVHIVDNLSASMHDVGEGSKTASLPVVSPVLHQPEAADSVSTEAEATGSVAPVSSGLATLPDGQIMSSLPSAVGLGRIEDSLHFGVSSVWSNYLALVGRELRRVAWGGGQMDCEDSVLSEFGKRGASELGERRIGVWGLSFSFLDLPFLPSPVWVVLGAELGCCRAAGASLDQLSEVFGAVGVRRAVLRSVIGGIGSGSSCPIYL
ncbi:hypothetical protein ACOSQ4_032306 [Xanthoceras sorbifolium]